MRNFLFNNFSCDFCRNPQIVSRIFFISFISLLSLNLANCQTTSSAISASLQYDGVFGIGWGVFAIILGIIVGVICCIFSRSAAKPGIYVSIGFCIPTVIFIFMAFAPLTQPGNTSLTNNPATNAFIIIKWLFFSIMLCALLMLLIPFVGIWSSMLIPQRVDSRAQREYFEKYEKLNQKKEEMLKNESDKKNDGIPEQNINQINPIAENETRIRINDKKYSVKSNNKQIGNFDTLNNNLNDKKKNFLGGLLRKRKNDEP